MTLLSRKADYALLILSFLHQKTGTARAIAEKFSLSRAFVANILKELTRLGFVDSSRGVKGGYSLARPATAITLAEIFESLEDGFRLTVCNSGAHTVPGDQDHATCALAGVCTLKGPLAEVHHRLLEVLRAVTLAELFDPSGSLNSLNQASALYALPLLVGSGRATQSSRA